MRSHRVNRYIAKVAGRDMQRGRRGQLFDDRPIRDQQTGFIYHPLGFPLEIKRKWFPGRFFSVDADCPEIGFMFKSDSYHKPGTVIEITIPLQDRTEKFTGKVVLVRDNGEFYETGMWLKHEDDATRARIVAQLCHIEAYMRKKKYHDGPYNLNPERVAREWIAKYASTVPGI